MDTVRELQHQVSIMDAVIQAVPKPHCTEVMQGVARVKDDRNQLYNSVRKKIFLACKSSDDGTE